MIKILFVCWGNICRSPMAEYIMKKLVSDAGMESLFEITSAGVSREELGNPVYPPARRKLAEHGISCQGHRAHQITEKEYRDADMVIIMDRLNYRRIKEITHGDPEHKISFLMDYTGTPRDIEDPWYTGDFEQAWEDILAGCTGLLEELINSPVQELTSQRKPSSHR